MSYFAEPNHIEYDAWFDENIDPLDLVDYSDEKEFSDLVHSKFHKISTRNLTILCRICPITFSSCLS